MATQLIAHDGSFCSHSHGESFWTASELRMQVFAELVRMPEGEALNRLFDDVCDGLIRRVDFAQHLDVKQGPAVPVPIESGLGAPLTASDTVFLLIRNECAETVTITIQHEIKILFAIPLSAAQAGTRVRCTGAI
jgi:hypothetical protein